MEKKSKKHLKALVILFMWCVTGNTQSKGGMENYNFLSKGNEYVWMPVLHYETKKGMYAELRYNYEAAKTFSVFGGKIISSKNNAFSITPMLGFSTGQFTGVSLAVNTEATIDKFFISSENQFSVAAKRGLNNFLFSWSEIGYAVSPNLFAGLSFQYTLEKNSGDPEPGLMAGLSFKNISIPVYVFSPFQKKQYIVLGLNYEYHLNKRK